MKDSLSLNFQWKSKEECEIENNDDLFKNLKYSNVNIESDCLFQIKENDKRQIKEILICPSSNTLSLMETLIQKGEEKEKKYLELKKIKEEKEKEIKMKKEDMEKLFLNKIKPKDQLYFSILQKLIENIQQKTLFFLKEVKEIQKNLIKIRNSTFISFYYKIFVIQYKDVMNTIYHYSDLICCNKQNIISFVEVYIKMIQTVAHNINEEVLNKIKSLEFFLKYEKEIRNCLSFIEHNIQYFTVARYIGNSAHKYIFSASEEPVNAQMSEKTFTFIKDILDQFPSMDNMIDNFEDKNAQKEMLNLAFSRDFRMYNTFNHIKAYKLIYDFLLYCD